MLFERKYCLQNITETHHVCVQILNEQDFFSRQFNSNMVFLQVIAAVHALFEAVGLPGNLLLIVRSSWKQDFM